MLKKNEIEAVLEKALSRNGDFAELFFERTDELQISMDTGYVQGVKNVCICGAGLHLLDGVKSVYVYTNDISFRGLMTMAEKASELIGTGRQQILQRPKINLQGTLENTMMPVNVSNNQVKTGIKLMQEADSAVRNGRIKVQSMQITYFGTVQKVQIANSEGLFTGEERKFTRIRYIPVVGDGIRNQTRFADIYRPCGMDAFVTADEHIGFGLELVKDIDTMKNARTIKPCSVPVILEAGTGATFFHECVGHMLEAGSIANGKHVLYGDKLGKSIASPKVTLVDDATIPGALATSVIDDEGAPRRRNVLIENGILKNYLADRLGARMLGIEPNGCGRRQNYTFKPGSRMSNTWLMTGNDDEEEMVRDIDRGLYIKTVGGGQEGDPFSIEVQEAFWIEKGEITYPVKGVMITGNGIELMKKVDRVGRIMGKEDGAFCGMDSGLIPTTTNQPRIRLSEVNLG